MYQTQQYNHTEFDLIEEIHNNKMISYIKRETAQDTRELVLGCLIIFKSVIQNACWKSRRNGQYLFESVREIERKCDAVGGSANRTQEHLYDTLSSLGSVLRNVSQYITSDDHDTLYHSLSTTYRLMHKYERYTSYQDQIVFNTNKKYTY